MTRLTVDTELLFVQLLASVMDPDVYVVAAPDVDLVANIHLPALVVSAYAGHMVSNGQPGLGWEWTVSTTLLGYGHQAVSDLADESYRQMHMLHDNHAGIDGIGGVTHIEDDEMPNRVATSVLANNLTQYTGRYTVVVQPPVNP